MFIDESYQNEKLKYAISKLSEKRKEILSLYIDGYTTKKIAKKVNITEKNVTVTMTKIKKFIKKIMEEKENEGF